jgi:hypothetical protein
MAELPTVNLSCYFLAGVLGVALLEVEALSALFFALWCFLVCFFTGAFVEASGVEPDFGVDGAPAWAPNDRAATRAVPSTKLAMRFMF